LALGVVAFLVTAPWLEGAAGSAQGPSDWIQVFPPVVASFTQSSYSSGQVATLDVYTRVRGLTLTIGRADSVPTRDDLLTGEEVQGPVRVSSGPRLLVRIGAWPSGLYFARLDSADGQLGFAPFVVRPRRFGANRIAVFLPTNTWQAYNLRDSDRDGVGDSWYASPRIERVDVTRPFLDNGVPPHFRGLDAGFLEWFDRVPRAADFFSDADLNAGPSGDQLARMYDLIVFPGHEEYVTEREYSSITRYRDLGGNLIFLSADSFFRRVRREGRWLVRLQRWRDVGRPESALVGAQYLNWNENRFPNRPLDVVGSNRAPWLFAGTGLHNGSRFGLYGIEIDARTAASPRGTEVLATITNIFGRGESADMTYYETGNGAKVFDAGVMNFGGTTAFPIPGRMLDNLWARLSSP
jgi:hypothetical protein